eukprot:scaffold9810_cov72-Phaeocystis_antarctica.AAC.2
MSAEESRVRHGFDKRPLYASVYHTGIEDVPLGLCVGAAHAAAVAQWIKVKIHTLGSGNAPE